MASCSRSHMPSAWGLPNWRDADAYAEFSAFTLERWRWEFTRRRPDIRKAFQEMKQISLDMLASDPGYEPPPPGEGRHWDEPGFWACPPHPNPFQMAGIPNPAISDQSLLEGLFDRSLGGRVEFGRADPWEFEALHHVILPKGYALVTVDLDKPIRPQLRSAEAELSSFSDAVTRRPRMDKWVQHLRVLDAREDGASWKEIASAVLRSSGDYAPQAAAEAHDRASALRDNWPY